MCSDEYILIKVTATDTHELLNFKQPTNATRTMKEAESNNCRVKNITDVSVIRE